MTDRIGFIGLGIMGRPMARNLIEGGCDLVVHDIDRAAVAELVAIGAQAAESPAEVGAACNLVFTMLPNGTIVQQVLLEPNGVAGAIAPGSLVVDMSSVQPGEAQTCAQGLLAAGVHFMDAPVSGGESGAVDGTLAFMVGGEPKDFERMRPYFDLMGASAVLTGPVGSGSTTKLANQIIVNLNIAAVAEALVLATKAGMDPQTVYEAIRGGAAGSAILEAKAPRMIRRDFQPGGKISINLKDIKNVMATAHELDVPLPFTAQLLEVMQALKVDGHLDDDHGGIVQYFERLADVEVGRPNMESDQ